MIAAALLALQVDEGQTEIIDLREADPRLGSLITALIGLGVLTLAVTAIYWWMTRPAAAIASNDRIDSDSDSDSDNE